MTGNDRILPMLDLSEESAACLDELRNSSDRSAVLVGVAFLDDALRTLIRARLIDKSSVVKKLMGGRMPINSFAHRIRLAYCIGLLGNAMYKDLYILRRISTRFTRTGEAASFQGDSVREECDKLKIGQAASDNFEATSRDRYITAVVTLLEQMRIRARSIEHLSVGKDFRPPAPTERPERADTQDDEE